VIDGLAVVDKPAGWTSHDVVDRCRRTFGQRRVGHSGTLDPDATGVLLVGLGRVTRLLRFLSLLPKAYTGEIVLGTATSTLDHSGDVVAEWDMTGVGPDEFRSAARRFVGEILQVPPMVSSVKVGGRRLHELARRGIEVERQARRVVVSRFDVEPTTEAGVYRIEVECSSGTYVRALAADVGAALGGGAHLRNLRRTAVGSFTLAEARPLDGLGERDLLPPAEAVRDYPRLVASGQVIAAVSHGRLLPLDALGATGPGPWAVVDEAGKLLALYEAHGTGGAKPAVVLAPAG
jgi:tRNA pseudouridine55 synthase